MRYRAYSDFEVNYPRPLQVARGDSVCVGRRDTTWSEWLWVTDNQGNSGWMHESMLRIDGAVATADEDYSAVEISVSKNEEVASLRFLGGWHWCRKDSGEEGWIPGYNLEQLKT